MADARTPGESAGKPAAPPPRAGGFRPPDSFLKRREEYLAFERLGFGSIYYTTLDGVSGATASVGGRELINFSGYNYLGMSGEPEVSRRAKEAIDRYGTSVSASRLVSGERPIHRELEMRIARLLGVEDCVAFVSGFTTNESVIGQLCGPGDLILHDSLVHTSVQIGCRSSGATVRPFPHNSLAALERYLAVQRAHYRRVLVVIEGIYSVDGDIPDLPGMIALRDRYDTLLMIDEAHSIGVLGERGGGIGEHFGVDRAGVDVWMGTLSKSFASCGGYIAGSAQLVEYLKYTTPGMIFSVGMSPPNAAAALAAIELMEREPQRLRVLHERAAQFLDLAARHGIPTGTSRGSAVVPVILGETLPCVQLSGELRERGILALPIVHPAVPENASRVRFFISSAHSAAQIATTVETVAECLRDMHR